MPAQTPRPRRPAMLEPAMAEQIVGDEDPAVRSEIAHQTAQILVGEGRSRADDPELVDRLVTLVEREGLDAVATLWSRSPSSTLPGALWRLYLLREWVRRDPRQVSERYRLGERRAEVAGVVAGVAQPPGPQEVVDVCDAVMSGMFTGDLAVQLDRAAAFLRVLAPGTALDADWIDDDDDELAFQVTRRAGALLTTAEELESAAALWRADRLD